MNENCNKTERFKDNSLGYSLKMRVIEFSFYQFLFIKFNGIQFNRLIEGAVKIRRKHLKKQGCKAFFLSRRAA